VARPTVLALGGGGFYGRYFVDDVLRHTDARVLVVSRRPTLVGALSDRVATAVCDRRDLPRLREIAAGCSVLVNLTGPSQHAPLEPLLAACAAGIHYMDIAEDRDMSRRIRALDAQIRSAGVAAFNGLSVVPGMEALVARMLTPCFDTLTSFRAFAAPDTKRHRGKAMFWTMMYGVGRGFDLPRDGRRRRVRGWSEGEWVDFPPPLGNRLMYLVLEMADAEVLPDLLGVQTVEFKAGSEWPLLNRLLALASTTRARLGGPAWERFTPLIRPVSWIIGRFGKNEGGVLFEASGPVGAAARRHRIAVVGVPDGGRIPSLLAGIAVEELLAGRFRDMGVVNLATWLSPERLVDGLRARGVELWWLPDGAPDWRLFTFEELALSRHQ
jgi:hypothetical protein